MVAGDCHAHGGMPEPVVELPGNTADADELVPTKLAETQCGKRSKKELRAAFERYAANVDAPSRYEN